ncbi:MAG TPA: hypothetical protein VGB03_03810 [Acidimicrobiales bacterium]
MSERSVPGTPFNGGGRPSKSFGRGRVCKEPGCETRLSMYNSGKHCSQHEPLSVPRTRGKKIA